MIVSEGLGDWYCGSILPRSFIQVSSWNVPELRRFPSVVVDMAQTFVAYMQFFISVHIQILYNTLYIYIHANVLRKWSIGRCPTFDSPFQGIDQVGWCVPVVPGIEARRKNWWNIRHVYPLFYDVLMICSSVFCVKCIFFWYLPEESHSRWFQRFWRGPGGFGDGVTWHSPAWMVWDHTAFIIQPPLNLIKYI